MRNKLLASLFAMIVMVILYGLTVGGLLGPNPVGTTGTDTNPLIVPSGYAFSIWGIIYIGLIVFPIYHWFKTPAANHDSWRNVHTWYTLNVVSNGLWLVGASYDWLWITVAIIIVMLVSLVMINKNLLEIQSNKGLQNYWLEKFPFSIYFAWITLATALNFSSALAFYGWDGLGISEINWTLIIMIVAAAIAGYIAYNKRDIAYAGVVIWAFLAIALKHSGSITSITATAYVIMGLFFVLIALLLTKSKAVQRA